MLDLSETALDTQRSYDALLRAHSALMDRIIEQMEQGGAPAEADLRRELQLRMRLDRAVAAGHGRRS